jgi:hypothetical protein
LANVGPEKGGFRTFLLTSLRYYVLNEHIKVTGPTRHPGKPILSIDAEQAESRYRLEPSDVQDPAKLFERRWAFTLIELVLTRLKEWCAEA